MDFKGERDGKWVWPRRKTNEVREQERAGGCFAKQRTAQRRGLHLLQKRYTVWRSIEETGRKRRRGRKMSDSNWTQSRRN